MYFNYNETTDNIKTVERILKFTKEKKLLLATDSKSCSTTWHDIKTNPRGKALEEFLTYKQLHIMRIMQVQPFKVGEVQATMT